MILLYNTFPLSAALNVLGFLKKNYEGILKLAGVLTLCIFVHLTVFSLAKD